MTQSNVCSQNIGTNFFVTQDVRLRTLLTRNIRKYVGLRVVEEEGGCGRGSDLGAAEKL